MLKKSVLLFLLLATPAAAQQAPEVPPNATMTLDSSWFAKLGNLCNAAVYGSRMVAEPICGELTKIAQDSIAAAKAQAQKK